MNKRLIAIAGPPCSGKSATGAVLAEILKLGFLETDEMVEKAAGASVEKIFHTLGETTFRQLETEALRRAVSGADRVIALGGGTLLNRENLTLVLGHCRVFTLYADTGTLWRRNSGGRPLTRNRTDFQKLMEIRSEHYLSLPGRICSADKTPSQTALLIAEVLIAEDPVLWSR
ncbi:MAG TPA: shikimate kinase [Candidatus Sabulitectum sp.]|nr:shikimate kinase [Candidatus Sabulitectum sp.]HPR22010.1 shikimate kinase [Candidatus Sabulitectum sp.]